MKLRNDLDLYERHAAGWWIDGDARFRSLRSVGEFHLGLIDAQWGAALRGARIVDLGCGGGHLTLALAQRGGRVTGVDRSPASLVAARGEAQRRGTTHHFLCADVCRTPLGSRQFDFVVLSDVLEHVEDPARVLSEAGRLLRSGGGLFVNTFDRTRTSGFMVVHVAEGLGLVPRGTHDARLFVRPAELEGYASRAGLRRESLVWEQPALLRSVLSWTIHLRAARRGFGYSAFFTKESA